MFWIHCVTRLALSAAGPFLPAAGHTIAGQVSDSGAAPLASARVALPDLGRTAITDEHGRYTIANVGDGTYRIAFSFIGFAPVVRRVTVAGADVTVDIRLQRSLIELPALQVTATPDATEILSSPQPVAVVAGADLEQRQAASVGETLRGVAGVHSLATGVGIGKPVIRGLTSTRVLVLDNGQRMETSQWGDEHGPNIETAAADRIEVIKGPASVLYGSDALGGVVNVVPRDLPQANGTSGLVRGTVSAAYGSNNRSPDAALLVEGAAPGGFGFRGTLSGRTSSDLKTPDYTLWNSANQAAGGSGAIGWRGSASSITATVSQRNERISHTDEDPTATPLQRIATTRGRVSLSLPAGSWRVEGGVGYERNRRREFEAKSSSDVALGLETRTWTGDLHLHHPSWKTVSGIIGLSGFRTRFAKFGEETLIPNSAAYNAGLFLFEQAEVGRLSLSAGARFDHRHLNVADDAELGVAAQLRNYNSLTGNLGVLVHLAEPVAVVLNVGRGYRAPSTFDLFSNGVHEGTVAFERGNPNLRNETSLNTDLAVRARTSRLLLEVGGFHNRIDHFIYTVPTGERDPGSGFEIFDVTQGNATLLGFESSVEYHPFTAIHLTAGADYTRGQNRSTDQPLPLIPPLRLTYRLRLEGRSRGTVVEPFLLLGGETNARQKRQDPAEAAFYQGAFDGAGYRSRGYSLFELGGGVSLRTRRSVVRVLIMARNLLDTRYASYLDRIKTNAPDPGMGRNVTLRLTTDF
jgi:iron complex outermembrane receptor protein